MSLGFGRVTKPRPLQAKSPPAAMRHQCARPSGVTGLRRGAAAGLRSPSAIGPAGGLQGVRIARSSGKTQLDQAAIATVQSAAPFPPPAAGVNPTFSIQIYFH